MLWWDRTARPLAPRPPARFLIARFSRRKEMSAARPVQNPVRAHTDRRQTAFRFPQKARPMFCDLCGKGPVSALAHDTGPVMNGGIVVSAHRALFIRTQPRERPARSLLLRM